MKIGKRPTILLMIAAMTMTACFYRTEKETADPGPTAIVVDNETGEPIEGASAMAVWWAERSLSWFEGSFISAPMQLEYTVSDAEGRIFIPDFWKEGKNPVLSVYKCGYVCWNQLYVKGGGKRNDFDKENRVVQLKKWPEDFSFIKHYQFISFFVTRGLLQASNFYKDIYECEVDYRVKERRQE